MPSLPGGLDPVAGVDAARAVGLEVGLLVLAAGDVVAEDPAAARGGRRSRRRAGRPRSPASPRAGWPAPAGRAGWPCPRARGSRPRSSRSARAAPGRACTISTAGPAAPAMATPEKSSAGEHLLDAPAGDRVARGGAAVAGHHHAAVVADREHGGAVGDLERHRGRRCRAPRRGGSSGATSRSRSTKDEPGSCPGANEGIGDSFTRASLYGRSRQLPRPHAEQSRRARAASGS